MNLHYLVEANHWAIEASAGVEPFRGALNGETALGVRFPAGLKSTIRIKNAAWSPHIKCGQDEIGWHAHILGSASRLARGRIQVDLSDGANAASTLVKFGPGQFTPVLLPSALSLPDPFAAADLVIECKAEHAPVQLLTSRRVDRTPLYRLARGNGLEIGPGPRPQIHNGAGVSVRYVEEKSAADWLNTYKPDVSDKAWNAENYILGQAHDLPADDQSLDFIFSSHVIEHLYNPLGHFEHWRSKLKKGGLVLGVVPCLNGTKDFVLPPTTLPQLLEEQRSGAFRAPIDAFRTWVAAQRPHEKDVNAVAEQLMETGFSIHLHVFDNVLAATLLRHCVEALGYSDFALHFKPNSKDFAFALKA